MSTRRLVRGVIASVRREPVPQLVFASLVGWGLMVWTTLGHGAHAEAVLPRSATGAAHTVHGSAVGLLVPDVPSWSSLTIWLAMVLAMSPLLVTREVARVWRGSLRRVQVPALAVFVMGYTVLWLLVGIIAVPLGSWLSASVLPGWLTVVMVTAWHCSPARQRLLNLCHHSPSLRVFGAAAYGDSLRYGVVTGVLCAAVCGPLMLLVLLIPGWHLVAMVIASAVLTIERALPARRPRWQVPFARGTASRSFSPAVDVLARRGA